MTEFAIRLAERVKRFGPLCAGIDPSAATLSKCGLPDTAEGAFEFGKRIMSAANYEIAVVKPQSAFFERFGSAGVKVIEELAAIVEQTAKDAAVKGVVITSAKDAFCAGADLSMLEGMNQQFAQIRKDKGEEAAQKMLFDESRKLSQILRKIGAKYFAPLMQHPEARALWWPRFERIAVWFANWERERRSDLVRIIAEQEG